MISLSRNKKTGVLTEATGMRVRTNYIYSPDHEQYKLSRSKFSDFLKCQRCFYLDQVGALKYPGSPGWPLNSRTDELLKNEFDRYRLSEQPHPIFQQHNLNYIPYQHEDLDKWRNSLSGGIGYSIENTNLFFYGGVDDVWQNTDTKELIICDYKSKSKKGLTVESFLADPLNKDFFMQMGIYIHILKKMNFDVFPTGYFLVVNGQTNQAEFGDSMKFESLLIPYKPDISWIDDSLQEMYQLLNTTTIPLRTPHCENCAYMEQGSKLINT